MSLLRENRTLALVCLVIVLAATTVWAQQGILCQGVVKPSQINVFAGAPSTTQVTGTLKHGDVVDVVLHLAN
jgi:hypothetical protein